MVAERDDEAALAQAHAEWAATLDPVAVVDEANEAKDTPLFKSSAFRRLWFAQFVSALGDWLGLAAITALAARIGGGSSATSVGLVLSARLIPGFFLAPVTGVLIDRWDRKRVMVACSLGRGVVLLTLPFVDSIPGLIVASLLLEVLTLMWSPAKEASVPNLVPPASLASANALSLVAAYGTFPLGTALFALLAKVAQKLGEWDALSELRVSQETVGLWVYALTCVISAVLVATLPIGGRPTPKPVEEEVGNPVRRVFAELAEGWKVIGTTPLIRAVMLGLSVALIGGGMIIPLGPIMSTEVFDGGQAGYGLLLFSLGTGGAVGIILLSWLQRRLPHQRVFVAALLGAGLATVTGASMSSLKFAVVFVALIGLFAGSVYVLGFTLLQTSVEDVLRGRIFATLNTLVRFCILLSFVLAPAMTELLGGLANQLFDGHVELAGIEIALQGARLTLWMGGTIILVAGVLAHLNLRSARDDS